MNDLIDELRAGDGNGCKHANDVMRRAADALEATEARAEAAEREMHARELHHFEEEKLRAIAEATIDRIDHALRMDERSSVQVAAAKGIINQWKERDGIRNAVKTLTGATDQEIDEYGGLHG